MTTQEKAQLISDQLHPIETTSGETRIVWRDSVPPSVREWFNDIAGNYTDHSLAALDEVYTVLDTLADILIENDIESEDDASDIIYAHQWSYDSNYDLLQWLAGDTSRMTDADDAIERGAMTITGAISDAMQQTRGDMAMSFYNSLNDLQIGE